MRERKKYRQKYVPVPLRVPSAATLASAILGEASRWVSPETRLVAAMLARAVHDLRDSSQEHRRAARRFFHHPDCEMWCAAAGIDSECVRGIASRWVGEMDRRQQAGAQ